MHIDTIDFKKLFESSPGLYLILTPDFTIVAVTDAYLNATMTQRENILGHNIFEIFPDNPNDVNADGASNLRASLNNVLKNKVTDTMAIQKYDVRKPMVDGGEFEMRYWSPFNVPILDSNQNVEYIIHRAVDVTEFVLLKEKNAEQTSTNKQLKTLNEEMELEVLQRGKEIQNANKILEKTNLELNKKAEELKRSNEELTQFAATASHDIKAPFRTVGGYLDIIKSKLDEKIIDDELEEAFNRITAARSRITNLLDDLLRFSEVTENDIPFEEVDLNNVINDALKNLDYNIQRSNANIIIPEQPPVVKGHPSHLVQLFQNLISNGIKFQSKGTIPQVIITVETLKSYFQFIIEDNGIGIEPEYFKRIFMVFERLNNRRDYAGSGLGLSICKRIVDNHGGNIFVESEFGKGTKFYFTLPRN